jgi:hypothetical protein
MSDNAFRRSSLRRDAQVLAMATIVSIATIIPSDARSSVCGFPGGACTDPGSQFDCCSGETCIGSTPTDVCAYLTGAGPCGGDWACMTNNCNANLICEPSINQGTPCLSNTDCGIDNGTGQQTYCSI